MKDRRADEAGELMRTGERQKEMLERAQQVSDLS